MSATVMFLLDIVFTLAKALRPIFPAIKCSFDFSPFFCIGTSSTDGTDAIW